MIWAVAVIAVASTATLLVASSRVRRLDRLHRRLDAARAALDAALVRRAEVARRAGVDTAATARGDREVAANALGRVLAVLDRGLLPEDVRADLADAEQMLALARRVHNDAVRDTLGLRSLWMVRRLHLAGHAPMPRYFEIADPVQVDPVQVDPVQVDPVPDEPVPDEPVLGAICMTSLGAPGRD